MNSIGHGRKGLILAALLLAGCATQELKVTCDGKLQPINVTSGTKVAQLDRAGDSNQGRGEVAQ
jgi:hypothetical protein